MKIWVSCERRLQNGNKKSADRSQFCVSCKRRLQNSNMISADRSQSEPKLTEEPMMLSKTVAVIGEFNHFWEEDAGFYMSCVPVGMSKWRKAEVILFYMQIYGIEANLHAIGVRRYVNSIQLNSNHSLTRI